MDRLSQYHIKAALVAAAVVVAPMLGGVWAASGLSLPVPVATLLKLLVEELKPFDGTVSRKSKLGVAMFSQHHVDQLELSQTPL